MDNSLLYDAIMIATIFHEGQVDKIGEPYILHPIRIMTKCETDEERIVAVLHDTLEDTELTIEYLKEEDFPEYIIEAIDTITRKENESYFEYIERVKENELALKVKLLDLEDNLDESRLSKIEDNNSLKERYIKAKKILEERSKEMFFMKMEKLFVNEKERIEEVIENLEQENCITNLFKYLEDININNLFERKFHRELVNNEKKLYKRIILDYLRDKSMDNLKELLIEAYSEGTICYSQADYDEIKDFILYRTSDEEVYPIIKHYMKECLNNIVEESKTSEKEKEIQKIKETIKRHEESIESFKKIIEENKERMNEIYNKM